MPIDPSREAELERLLLLALDLPADRWRPFLEGAASDLELAREAETLLRKEAGMDELLAEPLFPTETERTALAGGRASASADLSLPIELAGRYRLVELLGRGGMGEVYRAEDGKLGGEIALKLLPPSLLGPRQHRQLLGEVRIARQVTHPNVCRVHDIGEAEGLHFLTMELILGESLAEVLRRGDDLSIDRACRIGAEICDGLGAVHQLGILHRDIKPANVMIDESGRARLADFGIAGSMGEAAIGGTPDYMAPELLEGENASVQSELFALGVLLYQLLTSRKPFERKDSGAADSEEEEFAPQRPSLFRSGIPTVVEQALLRCLAEDPRQRPMSATAVASALRGGPVPAAVGSEARLREREPPAFPDRPYPVLLPYRHPDLLAGRDREIEELLVRLRLPIPILALSAPSGVGKSSLLEGGLLPALLAAGRPAVVDRYPAEPGLVGRLLEGLLESRDGISIADTEPEAFVDYMIEVETLAGGTPPVLILDQVEDLFRLPGAVRARATLGLLLASACRRRPGRSVPPCRFVLAHREEYHGALTAWLADVRADAEREGIGRNLDALPRNLGTPDRWQSLPLQPLATLIGSSVDPIRDVAGVFLSAIRAPLAIENDGEPLYPWRFVDRGDERLATAFAEARLDQPEAPLAPALQVVLSHLLEQARGPDEEGLRRIVVPDNVGRMIDEALDDHLRRTLELAFPPSRFASEGRARALLALRELASGAGTRGQSLKEARLEQAIGTGGGRILEILAGPSARLIVPSLGPEGKVYRLSHDRIAEAIGRIVAEEGRRGGLVIDSELLALRRRIGLQSALHRSGEPSATTLPGSIHRAIARHADALLWDDESRQWWQACRRKRRSDLIRANLVALVLLVVAVVGGLTIRAVVDHRAERQATMDNLANGDPELAFGTLFATSKELSEEELFSALRRRQRPLDLLAEGLGGVEEELRAEAVLEVSKRLLPLVEEIPEERNERLASLLWALRYATRHDAGRLEEARALEKEALVPLRASHPPPEQGIEWVSISAGVFLMGARADEGRVDDDHLDELPLHRVTISAFDLLAHEVTNAQYRRLFPRHRGEDELPAVGMSWYDAVVYAAWLGGRLPTEAEWEYAARSGCEHTYCAVDGSEAAVDDVAWWSGNSAGEDGRARNRSVKQLAPNQNGLFDIYGNVWEWTADWYGPYSAEDQVDPMGPTVGQPPNRVSRGGGFGDLAEWTHPTGRHSEPPGPAGGRAGLRPARERAPGGP